MPGPPDGESTAETVFDGEEHPLVAPDLLEFGALEFGPAPYEIHVTDGHGNPVVRVVKDQPIVVEVLQTGLDASTVDPENPPDDIEVEFTAPGGATDRLTLAWDGNNTGPATFTSHGALSIEDGGEGGDRRDLGGFAWYTGDFGGFEYGDISSAEYDAGATVGISIGDAVSHLEAYRSEIHLIHDVLEGDVVVADRFYRNWAVNLTGLIDQVTAMDESPERRFFLAHSTALLTDVTTRLGLVEDARAWLSIDTVTLHEQVAVAARIMETATEGHRAEEPSPESAAVSPQDLTDLENDLTDDEWHPTNRRERSLRWKARKAVGSLIVHGITQALIGGYRLFVNSTGSAQLYIIGGTILEWWDEERWGPAWNEVGRVASAEEKWLALVDIIGTAATMGALTKWQVDTLVPRTGPRLRDVNLSGGRLEARFGTGRMIPRPRRLAPDSPFEGAPLGAEIDPGDVGMLAAAVRDGNQLCRKYNVIAEIRFTNVFAKYHRLHGAKPKGMQYKSKTIQAIDMEIGADPTRPPGRVGAFDPEELRRLNRDDYDDATWQSITERRALREDEWSGPIGDQTRALEEAGKIEIRDGAVWDVEAEAWVTGDHDIFDFRHLDGSPMSPELYRRLVDEFMASPGFQAMHGAHKWWDPLPGTYLALKGHPDDLGALGLPTLPTRAQIDALPDSKSKTVLAKWRADRNIYEKIIQQHKRFVFRWTKDGAKVSRGTEGAGLVMQHGEPLLALAPDRPPFLIYSGQTPPSKFAAIAATRTTPSPFSVPYVYPIPVPFSGRQGPDPGDNGGVNDEADNQTNTTAGTAADEQEEHKPMTETTATGAYWIIDGRWVWFGDTDPAHARAANHGVPVRDPVTGHPDPDGWRYPPPPPADYDSRFDPNVIGPSAGGDPADDAPEADTEQDSESESEDDTEDDADSASNGNTPPGPWAASTAAMTAAVAAAIRADKVRHERNLIEIDLAGARALRPRRQEYGSAEGFRAADVEYQARTAGLDNRLAGAEAEVARAEVAEKATAATAKRAHVAASTSDDKATTIGAANPTVDRETPAAARTVSTHRPADHVATRPAGRSRGRRRSVLITVVTTAIVALASAFAVSTFDNGDAAPSPAFIPGSEPSANGPQPDDVVAVDGRMPVGAQPQVVKANQAGAPGTVGPTGDVFRSAPSAQAGGGVPAADPVVASDPEPVVDRATTATLVEPVPEVGTGVEVGVNPGPAPDRGSGPIVVTPVEPIPEVGTGVEVGVNPGPARDRGSGPIVVTPVEPIPEVGTGVGVEVEVIPDPGATADPGDEHVITIPLPGSGVGAGTVFGVGVSVTP